MIVGWFAMEQKQLSLGLPRKAPRRSVFILPSAFTVGNIFCGFFALISTMHGNYDEAAKAVGIAIVLDGLDGRLARMANATSEFGLQLDSLADVISFGLAPAILMAAWGLAPLGDYGIFTAFVFLICGTMRLARFNTQAAGLKQFIGMAIPAGAGMVAAVVHFVKTPVSDPVKANLLAILVLVLSFLMISRIRYFSLKQLHLGRGKSHLNILLLSVLLALIYFYSQIVLLVLACGYAASGPLARLFQWVRPRLSEPSAETRQP
ncbi:MAG: CDP-diacylglycerol--serine O-phosphatidyltransferase [Acidobacteria bacterium]|nr:CDP-diacylglycerol--serine O-phosphatidyltransferase [Acidobacteriota bacterium]